MRLTQHQSNLLSLLRCDTPVEIDPSEFTVALSLHDAGLLRFIPNGPKVKILAVLTPNGERLRTSHGSRLVLSQCAQ